MSGGYIQWVESSGTSYTGACGDWQVTANRLSGHPLHWGWVASLLGRDSHGHLQVVDRLQGEVIGIDEVAKAAAEAAILGRMTAHELTNLARQTEERRLQSVREIIGCEGKLKESRLGRGDRLEEDQ
ncbi:hypothetical protein [Azospirillum tabaci]|uniref:hypothetical protein n=1 Tax=Azospirillum tabaci TaxID=2752310 RepID=UPI001661360B|nr:hypothetical protein [Azospirillum tabaci]